MRNVDKTMFVFHCKSPIFFVIYLVKQRAQTYLSASLILSKGGEEMERLIDITNLLLSVLQFILTAVAFYSHYF